MRDHPDHIKPVISGLWGFKNFLDRKFTKYMLNIFTDKIINKWYKQDEISSKSDELILEKFIWPLVNSSLIHDSHNCKQLNNFKPFPTKRILDSNNFLDFFKYFILFLLILTIFKIRLLFRYDRLLWF
jgi:hypothetical protein